MGDFALDVSWIITAIGVVTAAVASVGLAALAIAVTTRAFKYVRGSL